MQSLKFALAALLFASPALAQDDPADPNATPPADPNAGDPSMGGGAAVGDGSMDAAGGVVVGGAWGKDVMTRSYVLPASKVAVTADLVLARLSFSFTDPITGMTTTSSDTAIGLAAGGHYGVTDKIMAGATYALQLSEFEAKGPLTIYGAYQIAHDGKLSLAATANFTYDIAGETMGINAGLGLRYNVAPKVAVFTGSPFGPGPVGQHLTISLEDMGPITFDVLGGVGFQATPELFAYFATNLAHINISNSANAFFGADFIPVKLGGLYALNDKIDVTASFDLPDVKEIGFDLFAVSVGAIVRL